MKGYIATAVVVLCFVLSCNDNKTSDGQKNGSATTGSKSQLPDGRLAGLVGLHGLVMERLAPARLQELVGKAQNLKTVAVADEPEIQLVAFAVGGASLDEARQARLLFDGDIGAR